MRPSSASGRPAQSSSSSTFAAIVRGPFDERPDALGIGAAGGCDADAASPTKPEVDEDLGAGDVLVDLAVGEAGQRRLAAHHERLGLGGASGLGQADDLLREPERDRRVRADPVSPAHATTPTRTLRNLAPETPWPTCPLWPGSPLPQFGVPHMRQELASPTASIERHSS